MAKPRVFVSSTYYDLKYVRSSLDLFIESFGFDAVLSEKGSIAFSPDAPLDQSCYREVQNSDIYVLVIGGRYGSEASHNRASEPRTFYDRYESVTKMEFQAAAEKDIPVYILIDRSVYAEYQTFLRNRDKSDVVYAHVDSVNIFHFIEDVLSRPRNNPVQSFERFSEIEVWLREQWAGLFHELLHRASNQQQIASLAAQVNELAAVNETLKRYLEEVVSKVAPTDATGIIRRESDRLQDARARSRLRKNPFVVYFSRNAPDYVDLVVDLVASASSMEDLAARFARVPQLSSLSEEVLQALREYDGAVRDLNLARSVLKLPPLVFETASEDNNSGKTKRAATKRRSARKSTKSKAGGV